MPFYHFYHIEHFRLVRTDLFQAADDAEAVRDARLLERTAASELWEGGRKIATLEAAGRAGVGVR